MPKKKVKSSSRIVRNKKSHPKSALITWIILGVLVVGLFVGYMVAKVKYMHYIDQISIMFSQRDSELNEMKKEMTQTQSDPNKVEF